MLLQVMTLTADVRRDFDARCQPDPGDLTEGRVRLLRSGRIDPSAHPSALRAALQSRHVALGPLALTRFAHELIDCGHAQKSPGTIKKRTFSRRRDKSPAPANKIVGVGPDLAASYPFALSIEMPGPTRGITKCENLFKATSSNARPPKDGEV